MIVKIKYLMLHGFFWFKFKFHTPSLLKKKKCITYKLLFLLNFIHKIGKLIAIN